MAQLTIADDAAALARTAAERVTSRIEEAIATRGSALVCLTGGSTPRALYSLLADGTRAWRARIDWSHVHLFFGDERHVPPDHADSNYRMAFESLIQHVPIPASQVHRMRGELADAAEAAHAYDAELHSSFNDVGRNSLIFDLLLLGIGDDAHVASIFPGSPLLEPLSLKRHLDEEPHVAAMWAAHLNVWRITVTPTVIRAASHVLLLTAGEAKAAAVHAALEATEDVRRWPAQLLREADDKVEAIIDRAAAARLREI